MSRSKYKKIGRNQLCPCGSGKKFSCYAGATKTTARFRKTSCFVKFLK